MTYAPHRSAIDKLNQGMIDGTYKQVNRDRGGEVEPTTYDARRDLDDLYFGIHEAEVKELPDGIAAVPPTFQPTPDARTDRG
jgi:hypothetical protein